MKDRITMATALRSATLAAGVLALATMPTLALAAGPVPNKGDTTWMVVATALVLMMSLPGLALFYGGLVRTKNMASVLAQVFAVVCLAAIIWVVYGYSLAFTGGGSLNSYVGGFSKAFLKGITPDSNVGTFSNGVVIPEYIYLAFQMTFACITPALIVGAFAERIKFSAVLLFTAIWLTIVYFPIAHMVWYWAGPDSVAAAAKAVLSATGEAKAAAQAKLDAVNDDAGLLFKWGALDFAGGTVVHINAGLAGLIGAYFLGKRIGYPREAMAPHSLTMTMIGASLLWVGWFGFNAGSNLEANGGAALAMINTFTATAGAILAWAAVEAILRGKASMLGAASGLVTGLVAVTPAAGLIGPVGAIVLGAVASVVSYFFVAVVKNKFGYDDSLDVFGIHGIGGIIGAVGTGIFTAPGLGGIGGYDYSIASQTWIQIEAVAITIVWCGVASAVLLYITKSITGLRVEGDDERRGLDLSSHGEQAYHS